jgi:hypothetical protein
MMGDSLHCTLQHTLLLEGARLFVKSEPKAPLDEPIDLDEEL